MSNDANVRIEESVLDAIRQAYEYNKTHHPNRPFSREIYRVLAKELELDYRSDSTARRIFGSWSNAVSNVVSEPEVSTYSDVDLEELNDIPNHTEEEIPYLTKRVVTRPYKILVLPDMHMPYHSRPAVEAAIKLGEEFKPDEVVHLGDLLDCYSLSFHPKKRDREANIATEIEAGTQMLEQIKDRTGAKKCTLLEGNHEARIRKYIYNIAPQLGKLKALRVDHLLDLKSIGWDFIPEHKFYAINDVHFTHGEYCTMYASKKHLDEYRETIIHGHTHRIACRFHRGLSKTVEAWEMGCLVSMDVSADYVKKANWQHCVGTIVIDGPNHWITAHHIRNGKVEFNGRIIDGR